MDETLLTIQDLAVSIQTPQGLAYAVEGLNLNIPARKTLALLGESGCGKSLSALSILNLLPPAAKISQHSQIQFKQLTLTQLAEFQLQTVRGRKISMIFQEPMTALNPVMTVAAQLGEVLQTHFGLSKATMHTRMLELLQAVQISEPELRLRSFPHELSGGMKQRIMIAMALAGEPDLLIADEPTTALDVTIQAQILQLLRELQAERGMAILLITHDLGVVSEIADEVAVMYAGHIVEQAPASQFFQRPLHPYSRKLFAALPQAEKRQHTLSVLTGQVPSINQRFKACRFVDRCPSVWQTCREIAPRWLEHRGSWVRCHLYDLAIEQVTQREKTQTLTSIAKSSVTAQTILTVENLQVHFPIKKGLLKRTIGYVKAVDGVSFSLKSSQTLAIVGESGCGKTTLGRAILQLIKPTAGAVKYNHQDLTTLSNRAMLPIRRDCQMIFQDPFSSMDPRMTVADIIAEGLIAHRLQPSERKRRAYIQELLQQVGLATNILERYPHEFSGGQRQRIAIARALALQPKIIICDEPTSALDVSVQAQILNLLKSLQQQFGIAYLFITHNIAVVSYLADEVAVMYHGRIVEYGLVDEILLAPKHSYTQTLLAAVPKIYMGDSTLS